MKGGFGWEKRVSLPVIGKTWVIVATWVIWASHPIFLIITMPYLCLKHFCATNFLKKLFEVQKNNHAFIHPMTHNFLVHYFVLIENYPQ